MSAYLQTYLLTGRRREEIMTPRWDDFDSQWDSLLIHDKVERLQIIPMTHVFGHLPRPNQWVATPAGIAAQTQGHRLPDVRG